MARSRRARPEDLPELALALPETAEARVWGDRPAFQVRGRSFVIYREPRPDALDEHGERLTDVVVVSVAGPEEKAALLAAGPPWFTTPHFDGYAAVLVRLSEIGLTTGRSSPRSSRTPGCPRRRSGWRPRGSPPVRVTRRRGPRGVSERRAPRGD